MKAIPHGCDGNTRGMWGQIHAEDSRQPLGWNARLGCDFLRESQKPRVSRGKRASGPLILARDRS
jgi:hypothetical protein